MAALPSISTPALADAGRTIVQRCVLGESLGGFSQSAYGKALKELSATTEEYSDCASLIRQAQRGAASGRPSATGSPASAVKPAPLAATPSEQSSIAGAARTGSQPLSVGGRLIHPGVVHADVASALSTLPAPLLAALGFVLACLLVLGAAKLGDHVRDGRPD